eukprot:SAG31_NODE_490_length_14932_cov_9.350300_11_plen_119_part_00
MVVAVLLLLTLTLTPPPHAAGSATRPEGATFTQREAPAAARHVFFGDARFTVVGPRAIRMGKGCYFVGFVQLSEKHGTLIEKVSPCRVPTRCRRRTRPPAAAGVRRPAGFAAARLPHG